MTRQKDFRDAPPPIFTRPGVLGIFQKSERKRIRRRRFGISQNAGNKARNGIHKDHGRQLSAGQYIIPDGDFPVGELRPDPLIDPFIVPAEKDDAGMCRKLFRNALIEDLPLGG